jgi:hypothetical protein
MLAKALLLTLVAAIIGGLMGGCASESKGSGGTASLTKYGGVEGRDWGRGGATSGSISSLDPSGNAADWSVVDAREMGYR